MQADLNDNLVFADPKTGDKVIFNGASFLEVVKGCVIKYCNKTKAEAGLLIQNSYINNPPKSYNEVVFITHESLYHWAMIVTYGEVYWQNEKLGVSSIIPEDYEEWEREFIKENNLLEPYEYLFNNYKLS